ncbi:hypothetical protein [Flavobacterium sp. UMI-01]|uniref:hypothetical protein n=1 Tax=Flavobacterium sp. UMI-01 TaxID=1441053 RepID=UPI001C7D8BF0|nr:hypothetical protein [Flavobacterium sp. UMI-01]
MKKNKILLKQITQIQLLFLLLTTSICVAQKTMVDVNIDTRREVEGIDSFDRQKYITIHASITNDWEGDHVSPDIRKDFLDKYDVYLGRETGGLKGALNAVRQDPARPGYADVSQLKKMGENNRNSYSKKSHLHPYEDRLKNMIIGAQFEPFWPHGTKTKQGWALSQKDTAEESFGTATGEFMAHFIKEYYGGNGEPRPRFIEVINEPLWELIPKKEEGNPEKENKAVQQLAKFHSTVAREIKKLNPDVLVGGYTCAFPDFELYDFKRWTYRWKQFIDLTGNDMDFWSLHFYDFPCKQDYRTGKLEYVKKYRKGSNIEASLDMLEQYSMMRFGKLKPMVISEYSVQAHQYRDLPWTPWRDYLYVKSANALMMSFMDHPQSIAVAIPFFMLKSEWGRTKEGYPYRSRLFRQQFEKEGETGDKWVFTDLVKFYQLWSDVKGKRIDTKSNLVDIQTDAYVDGKKVYLIVNNLNETKQAIQLNVLGQKNNTLENIKMKHYYSPYKPEEAKREGIIEEKKLAATTKEVLLESEGTMVLEYHFKRPVVIAETAEEKKYYATENYKPIEANKPMEFIFEKIQKAQNGEVVLRLGLGRDHGSVLKPTVFINDVQIEVPENYAGDPQTMRDRFYGVIEIPLDYKLLSEKNTVKVSFPDSGGHVASATLRVFNFSKAIKRTFVPN